MIDVLQRVTVGASTMASTTVPTSPPAKFDAEGHILPWTEAEQAQHAEAVCEGTAWLAEILDEPGEGLREFFRAIDAERPERPLFKGYH